ncbi:hypothetical protein OIE67_16410 [Nonomuraea fuscirosea]|uniref:hypothetical protein n=1 Tax=Nonomuraea fuscirosea TaxID=1291556 RepID=UPI002DD8929D|nr:hypothetical protein [Nonomuraea fuscirosea]WSA56122.1 hypothetical protein OIE67_16410 [Nonomuraea fuscirosea]
MTFQNEARAAFRRGDLAGVLRLATTEAERAHLEARRRHLASIDLYEALRLPAMVMAEQHKLALAELRLGNRDRARVLLTHVRDQVFREGHRSMLPYLGLGACALASADGDHQQADARLHLPGLRRRRAGARRRRRP